MTDEIKENEAADGVTVTGETGTEQAAAAVKEPKHSGFSRTLNKFFHHIDRGGTLKGEVMAGLTVFFIAICVLFMNVQVIINALGAGVLTETAPEGPVNIANATTIATMYVGAVIVAFIGSLVIGLVARLPFVQMSTMGLSSSMVSLLGVSGGLTYYNILFVSFLAAIVYAVLVSVPVVRKYVFDAVPAPVRKALPAAAGLIVMFSAAQQSGFVTAEYVAVGGSGAAVPVVTGGAEGITAIAFAAVIIAIAVYVVLRALRLRHPVFWSMTGGTLAFILIMIIANGTNTSSPDSFVNFGRLWVMVGSQASETTPFGDSWFSYMGTGIGEVFSNFGRVFTEGTTFAEGVSAGSFVVGGILCYLFAGMYDAHATLQATEEDINEKAEETGKVDFDSEKGTRIALMCNAGMNVIAPLFGMCGVTMSKTSVAGTRDSGKSGIVPVVAAIGFLVSLFVWVAPVLFATTTYVAGSMNDFNYNAYGNGGFIATFTGLSFGVADAVMVCVGASMLRSLKNVEFRDLTQSIPVIATLVGSFVFTNLAYGVAAGVFAYIVAQLCSFRDPALGWLGSLKRNFLPDLLGIGIPTAVLCVLLIIMLALA